MAILENERVLLRPLQADDYVHLVPFAIQEPTLWQYSIQSAAGEDGMRAYFETALSAQANGEAEVFIIFDKLTQRYAGCTRFYDIYPKHRARSLGYTWYGSEFQRTGLNRHCKFLLLQYAFEVLNTERLEFRADLRNNRSINAMKAIGCAVEGVLRSNLEAPDGTRRDSIVLSILQSEWFNEGKTNLAALLR